MVIGMGDKIKTIVRIAGQEYRLTGYESEEYMHRVAIHVDRKMTEISKATPTSTPPWWRCWPRSTSPTS
jgi:hypothetical protein